MALTAAFPTRAAAALPGGSLESGPMWRCWADDGEQEMFLEVLAM